MDVHTTRGNAGRLIGPLLLAVLVLAAGCSSNVVARPTPTSQPTVTPTPHLAPTPVTELLAPPPADCQSVAAPHTMTLADDFGGGFFGSVVVAGSTPAWQLGLGGAAGPLNLEPRGPTPYPGTKVMWLVGPNYAEPITLRGHDLRTGTPIWLQLAGNGADNPMDATTLVALDPAMPNRGSADNPTGHWNIYGVLMYFTVAGCYDLEVAWPEGHWHTMFAVGR